MSKGRSKPELYILFNKGLKPREVMKLMPELKKPTVYYYSQRYRQAVDRLIANGLLGSDMKLKVETR